MREKDIKGYEGHYQILPNGKVYSLKTKRILKHGTSIHGYRYVNLSKNGIVAIKYLHRLVAENYNVGGAGNEVNHKDGIKTNNHVDNLEWCTSKENSKHANDVGIAGKKAYRPVVAYMGEVMHIFDSMTEAQHKIGVDVQNIYRVAKGHQKKAGGYYWRYV